MNPLLAVSIIGVIALLIGSRRSHASSSAPALPPGDDDSDIPPHLRNLEPMIIPPPGTPLDAQGNPITPAPTPGVDAATQADIDRELDKERTKLPKKFPSPFKGVSDDAWTKYVMAQRVGKLNTVSPGFALGIWGMGMRVLQDLGYATNVKLAPTADGRQVFKGDFVPPLTMDIFLSDAPRQYEAFRRMTERHAAYIQQKYAARLANIPDITLSGYLGVAKQAGLKGMDEWFTKPETRKAATTAAFEKFNKMF